MKTLVACAFFFLSAYQANATVLQGSFQANEVQPIIVEEYVPETCYNSDFPSSLHCDERGCQPHSQDYSYQCGGYRPVRKGSKLLAKLDVEYVLNLNVVSPGLQPKLEIAAAEIDQGYSKESFIQKFINFSNDGIAELDSAAVKINFEIQELNDGSKKIKLYAEVNMIDVEQVNETLKNKTNIVTKDSLQLSPELPLSVLDLKVCVYQKKFLFGSKSLGCENISKHETRLSADFFSNSNNRRAFKYETIWEMRGTTLSSSLHTDPILIFKQKKN